MQIPDPNGAKSFTIPHQNRCYIVDVQPFGDEAVKIILKGQQLAKEDRRKLKKLIITHLNRQDADVVKEQLAAAIPYYESFLLKSFHVKSDILFKEAVGLLSEVAQKSKENPQKEFGDVLQDMLDGRDPSAGEEGPVRRNYIMRQPDTIGRGAAQQAVRLGFKRMGNIGYSDKEIAGEAAIITRQLRAKYPQRPPVTPEQRGTPQDPLWQLIDGLVAKDKPLQCIKDDTKLDLSQEARELMRKELVDGILDRLDTYYAAMNRPLQGRR